MLLVIPSMDLMNGICKDCICSNVPMTNHYSMLSDNPDELSQLLRRENAKSLHINDLDSLSGKPNKKNIDTLLRINDSVEIPVQCYARYKTIDECKYLLDNGLHRVIIDDLLINKCPDVKDLILEYSVSRISFFAEIHYFESQSHCLNLDIDLSEYIDIIKTVGGDRLILKDISIISNIEKSIDQLNDIAFNNRIKMSLLDAAGNFQDLDYINKTSNIFIDSIILGRALFENKFPCQEIWRIAESRLEKKLNYNE